MLTPFFSSFRPLPLALVILALSGCSVTPAYQRPEVAPPAAYKEAAANGPWQPAQPADHEPRGAWWQVFQDPLLHDLETRAQAANPELQGAAARLRAARALFDTAQSARYPQIGAGLGVTRQRPSPAASGLPADGETTPSTLWRAQASASYEADLFGRVSAGVAAASADAESQAALYGGVLLALQADVADTYFRLRELDREAALYDETVGLRREALKLLQSRFDAGDIGELDLARGRTELASAEAESLGIARQRALVEHSLALLLGEAPANFSLPPAPLTAQAVVVPAGLPSQLLERRPDIAAAERAAAAANARVGLARSAWFPRLNLTGSLGYEAAEAKDLFQWSSRTFVLGPLVGTFLSLPLFDGGAREAELARAQAVLDESGARYRQVVLQAFREVEDQLAALRLLDGQLTAQRQAVAAARRAAGLSHSRYREGAVSYLDVIDADRSVLQQERVATQLEGARVAASVALIRALGGGWTAAENLPAQVAVAP